jgi:formamidopyrimidine-DNA glycosylase
MPELPEVESLCRQLKKRILNAEILDLVILDANLGCLENPGGRRVCFVQRRGKRLDIGMDDGRMLSLHLRMSGRLLWQRHHDTTPAHTRFIIRFAPGRVICIDPRRFATLRLHNGRDGAAPIADPLRDFSARSLRDAARGRALPVKSFLLDQQTIAGIGNIYACEMLHRSLVSPWRRAGSLSAQEWRRVAEAGAVILRKATACRGTSVSDWHDLHGKTGTYQRHLAVYGRSGCACPRCGTTVQRAVLGGRGTYFCPRCQPGHPGNSGRPPKA